MAQVQKPTAEQAEFFEKSVRPVLAESCLKCHGPAKQSSGLRLDSREAILEGGENGPAIIAGNAEGSLLIQAVRQTHEDIKMPPSPKAKLDGAAVDALAHWVQMGAPWPTNETSTSAPTGSRPATEGHWAFEPVRRPTPPPVKARDGVRSPIDAFILSRLEQEGLAPSPEAERATLIRRAAFDLTGLPPTPEEVASFVADRAPDAFERLVDRLLASPRYGERWGRHWLDVARYADTKGYVFQEERRYPYAYTYRDYVIRSFNEDLPYTQFVTEQLAADRLGSGHDPRSLAALGFLTLGRRFLNNQPDIIDDRIDVVCRGLLGLTVACARCHDHKFDPIPTDDYYSLYGVFASSIEPTTLPEIPGGQPEPASRDFREKVAKKQQAVDAFLESKRGAIEADLRDHAPAYLRAAFDLQFDGRSAKLDERAKRDQLVPARLRGIALRWKAKLDATRTAHDPIFAPWHAFAALPAEEFSRKAPGVARGMTASNDAKACSPPVARAFAENPPSTMAEVVARYASIVVEVNRRWVEARKANPTVQRLAEPEWESLRDSFFGEDGPFSIAPEALARLIDRAERNKLNALKSELEKLKATHPGSPPRAMVLNDAPRPVEPHIFLRGNPARPGKAVPRRFLGAISGPKRTPFTAGSGRLELAQAIASAENPLSARVLVNRVWLNHFGTGLVTTPSDFGSRCDPPALPALLDWLADDFVASGWSIKSLHRRIMLSSTYRQRSEPRSECVARDPENRLYWKFNRRRLDFEATRDALLFVSGALDASMGGRPVPIFEPPFPPRRTIYGFVDRQNLEGVYRTFDFANPDTTSPRRYVTTVPQQALFLMNSPFVLEQAHRLAQLPELRSGDHRGRVRRLYERLFGRAPDERELSLGLSFVGRTEPETASTQGLTAGEQYAQVLLLTNEFVFVD
jgi:hypothetical protein